MIINIKNMMCLRCKMVVENILTSFGLEATTISLGTVELKKNLSYPQLLQLNAALKEADLELVFDKKGLLDQKIKNIIFETIHYFNEPLNIKFSCYLSSRLNYNYTYLSKIFTEANGISIERYIILQKIEKVKSMLVSENVFLSEIAYKMNYSSVGHLSAQFKKVTGYTAKDYKSSKAKSYRNMPGMIAV